MLVQVALTPSSTSREICTCQTAHERYNSSDSEPLIITMGSVIANAIHDAAGARLLQLPMTPDRVKAALKRS